MSLLKKVLFEYFDFDGESFFKYYEIDNGHSQPCRRKFMVGAYHYECWAVWIDTTYVASASTIKQIKTLWKGLTNSDLTKKTI